MITVYSHRYDSPKWQAYVTPSDKACVFSNNLEVRSLFELKQALASQQVKSRYLEALINRIED